MAAVLVNVVVAVQAAASIMMIHVIFAIILFIITCYRFG